MILNRKRFKFLVPALFLMVSACQNAVNLESTQANPDCSFGYFYSLSEQQQDELFATCPLKDQIDLAYEWRYSSYPPNYDFIDLIINQGEQVAQLLVDRIASHKEFAESHRTLEYLRWLHIMQVEGSFDISKDSGSMARIENSIVRLDSQYIQKDYSDFEYVLEFIRASFEDIKTFDALKLKIIND